MVSQPSEKDYLAVVFASDDRGALQLGISIFSLLDSALPTTRYRVYILEDGISASNKEKILSLKQQFDTDIVFISVQDVLGRFDHLDLGPWTRAAFGRLFVGSRLPEEEMILYADIDVLFCRDLHEVFSTDMDGVVLGVIYEQVDDDSIRSLRQRLKMPPGSRYFNSGVLLMNLKELRARNGEEVMMNYFEQNAENLVCVDQDMLNGVFHDSTTRLHPKWNWTDGYSRRLLFKSLSNKDWGSGTAREVLEATDEPGILHFWGKYKPWRYNFRYEGDRYRSVWLRSPWKDVPMEGRTLKLACRRMMMKPVYALIRRRVKRLRKALEQK